MRSCILFLTLSVTLLAGLASCTPATPTPHVPYPDLADLETAVREQLAQLQARLEQELAQPLDTPASQGQPSPAQLRRSEILGEGGRLYHAYSLRVAAQACYELAELWAPQDPRWVYLRAHVHEDAGELELATKAYRRAMELGADLLPAGFHLGRALLDSNQVEAAETIFHKIGQHYPKSPVSAYGLGKIALARRQFDKAVELLTEAIARAPEATEIHYPLGLAYRGTRDLERARHHLDRRGSGKLTVADPLIDQLEGLVVGMRLHQNRGSLLYNRGQHERAAEEFRKAIAAAPDHPLPYLNLGSCLMKLGDEDGAIRAYQTTIRLDPEHPKAYFNLGAVYAGRGLDAPAIEHYRSSLKLDSEASDTHFNLANALRRTSQYQAAVPHYRQVLERDPLNSAARFALALTFLRLEQHEQAAALLEKSHELLPRDVRIANAWARVLSTSPVSSVRSGERALALATKLFEVEKSVEHLETRAMALAELGRFAEAIQWLDAGIQAAQKNGRSDVAADLEALRKACAAGHAWRRAWRLDHPALSPGPLSQGKSSPNDG